MLKAFKSYLWIAFALSIACDLCLYFDLEHYKQTFHPCILPIPSPQIPSAGDKITFQINRGNEYKGIIDQIDLSGPPAVQLVIATEWQISNEERKRFHYDMESFKYGESLRDACEIRAKFQKGQTQ